MLQFRSLLIRQRLPTFISISALVVMLLEGFFIYQYSVQYCEQEFRMRLGERLKEADSLIAKDRLHPFTVITSLPPGNLPDEKILYFTDPDKVALPDAERLSSAALPDTNILHHCEFCFLHIGQRDFGFRHDPATHHTLIISAIDRYGNSKLENLRRGLVCGVLAGVLLLTLLTWFWVKKMLKPLEEKIIEARTIGAKSLDLRLKVSNNHDELGQLTLTINEMLERIEKGFRAQQQFIRNASHEMRTPLAAITGEADLALQQERSPVAYRLALERIRNTTGDINELLGQLLLMAKMEHDTLLSDQSCAADEVLFKALVILKAKYPQSAQTVQVQLDAAAAANFLIQGDPLILQTAYSNILDNAIKYGNDQPVAVRLHADEAMVQLEVVDQGQGITSRDQVHVFEPFFRSKQVSYLPGSGIGLSLIKMVAEKYRGIVLLESIEGTGTKVSLQLPRFMV